MGNCICNKIVVPQDEKIDQPREAKKMIQTCTDEVLGQSSAFRSVKQVEEKKEKRVRFRLCEEEANAGGNSSETKGGVVRIRLVLTQKELSQILNGQLRHSSADQLLNAIKFRSKRISPARSMDGEMSGNWRPALESIPEDQ